jgi:hypothetical protein
LVIAVIGGILIAMVLSLIITPAVRSYLSNRQDTTEVTLPARSDTFDEGEGGIS